MLRPDRDDGKMASVHTKPVRSVWIAFILTCARLYSARGQLNEITFRLQEQQPSGAYVGSVPIRSDISRNISPDVSSKLTYNFLNPNTLHTSSLFSINRRNGELYTTAMIDRETVQISDKEVCAFRPLCEIKFDVTVKSKNTTSFLKFITVKIIIEDINDSPPTFEGNEAQVSVLESVNAGNKIALKGATDKDSPGRNSVQSYEITSYKDMFAVEFNANLDGSSSLQLVVLKGMDRELRDRYQFRILAMDGGSPRLTGTLTVNVHVADVNDNSPVFSLKRYNFDVNETAPVNWVVGTLSATDRDIGKNGRVKYRFSKLRPSKMEELFTLKENSGDLVVKKPLQYESGKTYEAVIEAVDRGDTPLATQASVVVTILDVGNTPPKITLNLASPVVFGDTILLAESEDIGAFIGRVKVVDNDVGQNGRVHCSSLDDHFIASKVDENTFAILIKQKLDRETKEKHNVTILCRDMGTPSLPSSAYFAVRVTDVNDNAPVFTSSNYYANVTENNNRTVNLVTVKATDRDAGINREVSYFLSMDAGSTFSIDRERGVIRSHGAFDRETISMITFVVKAVDHANRPKTGTASVTVNILDVNDNKPYFPPMPLKYYIPENLPAGRSVGQLTARDRDIGENAALQFKTLTNDQSIPFVVFSNGVIRTDRKLNREVKDEYVLHVSVTDNGQPPLFSNGTATIIVQDINDHPPTIEFPNDDNNTVTIYSDLAPHSFITSVSATDEDIGRNAALAYFITGGNKGDAFKIGRTSGDIYLNRQLTLRDEKRFRLTIEVQDAGRKRLEAQTLLNINIILTNSTIAASMNAERDAHKYKVIAGIVAGVTIILSIIIVSIILFIRRTDNMRRENQEKTGVQEECGKRDLERKIWQEVSTEDIKAGFDTPGKGDSLYKPKMNKDRDFTIDPDRNAGDSFLSHAAMDQFGKPEFFTFRKGHGPPFSEDVRSDASGETTTSDSGRGGSEEDIQLPPISDLKGFNGSHQIFSVAIDENEEFCDQMTPEELRQKSRTLSTFTNPKMASKTAPMTSSFKDIHCYTDPYNRGYHRNQQKVRFSADSARYSGNGKQVKFPNGLTHLPVINNRDFPVKQSDHSALSYPGSYNSLPRSIDDDDNTTTSGSYTLNTEDIEDVLCER